MKDADLEEMVVWLIDIEVLDGLNPGAVVRLPCDSVGEAVPLKPAAMLGRDRKVLSFDQIELAIELLKSPFIRVVTAVELLREDAKELRLLWINVLVIPGL